MSDELGVAIFKEIASYNFFATKLRVASYELNLELWFSKKIAKHTLKLPLAKVFHDLNF